MRELLLAAVGLFAQLAVYYCIGSLLMWKLKMKAEASLSLIIGYLAYFAVFEVIAVPMTLAWAPLKTLALLWTALLAAGAVCAVLLLGRQWKAQAKGLPGIWKEHSFWILVVLAVIGIQCLLAALYQDSYQDAAYYVGTVNTSVYTGTLGRYDPYTGKLLKNFQARYILSAYPMHNAVWCQLLGLPALIQCKVVMAVINVLMANIVIYQLGKRLFHGGKKQADMMVCFVCLLNLFSYTIYTPGTFLLTRSYEGKSMLANITVPMVLLLTAWLWQLWNEKSEDKTALPGPKSPVPREERNLWILLFLTCLSAFCFSGSAVIVPAAISAGILPLILVKKKPGKLVPYAASLIPALIYMGIYGACAWKLISLSAS